MTTTFKSRNPATCKSNTQMQKISSPKFQQVCCWLALKIKTVMKKNIYIYSLCTFIPSSQSMLRLKWAWVPSQQRTQNSKSVYPYHQNPQVPTESDTKTGRPGACGISILRASVDYVTVLRSTAKTSRDFNFQLRRERGNSKIERGRKRKMKIMGLIFSSVFGFAF